jgi:signal transduction histidine kinase
MNTRQFSMTRQSKILSFLLVACLILMGLLGWQAYHSVSQQRQVVNKVLLEYAHLAAEEYSRRIMSDIGYQGYFKTLNQWREVAADFLALPAQHQTGKCPLDDPDLFAEVYFIASPDAVRLVSTQCQLMPSNEFLQHELANINAAALDQNPLHFIHSQQGTEPVTLVVAKYEKAQWFGFKIKRSVLIEKLKASYDRQPVLPRVLADGKASNAMLKVSLSDHTGTLLFGEPMLASQGVAQKILQDEYSGIFSGYRLQVLIKPEHVEQVIAGGLPDSNLAVILSALLLLLFVFIISFFLLKKEILLHTLRERFVAEVSHELRTPLTQIRMFAEMLLSGRIRNERESYQYLQIINRETLRLNYLVDNVLNYSGQREGSERQITNIEIKTEVDKLVAEFKPLIEDKKVTLIAQIEPCELTLDIDRLRRIVLNLLDNAVKYGPAHQSIKIIGQTSDSPKAQCYRFSIEDQGPGIPQNEHANIWQAYYRLPRESQMAISGTGIGLYLVKRLADELGAKVWLENVVPNGCRFVLEFIQLAEARSQ